MTDFALDTSGFVLIPENDGYTSPQMRVCWDGLSPFAQGYIEAALARDNGAGFPVRFSDLAPETLAAMIKDCASKTTGSLETPPRYEGQRFWERRQAGEDPYFPPVVLFLSDDGKVRQQ